jgi:hypothetical protein
MTLHKLFLALALGLSGCSPNEAGDAGDGSSGTSATGSSSGGESCIPGEIQACLCPDESASTQICLADGSDFSACDCVSATSNADDSAGSGSGGTSETTGDASTGEGTTDGGTTGASTGPAPECDGSHPLVDGDLRFCEAGNCYCGDFSVRPPFDVCYAMEIAEPCCPVEVVCY